MGRLLLSRNVMASALGGRRRFDCENKRQEDESQELEEQVVNQGM
jgi:hypothetical protein